LSRQLEGAKPDEGDGTRRSDWERRFQELTVQEQRTTVLLRVLQSFYFALGGFASSTLAALLGAVLTRFGVGMLVMALEFAAVAGGAIGVASLVRGSLLLVHETGIAVRIVNERAARVRARARVQ
jgi:hypothetical protein